MNDNQKSPFPKREYTCQVDNFTTTDPDEFDRHIQETGHVLYDDTSDQGVETPIPTPDLMIEHRIGSSKAKGLSSGDFLDDPQTEENSKSRAFTQGEEIEKPQSEDSDKDMDNSDD